MSGKPSPTALAKTLSLILHPVLIPFYVIVILLSQGLVRPYAPAYAKLFFAVVVILNTVVVPVICILLFRKLRRNENRDELIERMLPMAVMVVCYAACMLMIREMAFVFIIRKMLTVGIACLLFGMAVTPFWKISLYMTAAGAAAAFIGVMVLSGAVNLMPVLCAAIALAAALASARLHLGAHNALQTASGFAGGLVVAVLTIYLI